MHDPERAGEIVYGALRTMKVDVAAVNPQESVLRVLDAARPTNFIFKLDLMRERLLRKIVDAVIVQREMGPDDREGYAIDLLSGSTVGGLIEETAKLIQTLEQRM